jgi:hypothetical protein
VILNLGTQLDNPELFHQFFTIGQRTNELSHIVVLLVPVLLCVVFLDVLGNHLRSGANDKVLSPTIELISTEDGSFLLESLGDLGVFIINVDDSVLASSSGRILHNNFLS